jgi:SAM-dependent methyltransferase
LIAGAPMRQDLASIEDVLACPECRGAVRCAAQAVTCAACGAHFAIQEGIPLFACIGSVGATAGESGPATSEPYQRQYQADDPAAAYNAMYRDRWTKRISTRREFRLLERLLSSQGRCATLLDLPCGGGRLSPPLARHADLLIEADIGLGQLRFGRRHPCAGTRQIWIGASGFQIPLRDRGADGVVCVRLNHHLPTAAERERLVRELLRVAGRFAIMTFFDHDSLKSRLRRLQGKPPKLTMRVSELRDLAAACGARLAACPALFVVGSGHRYALMVKEPAPCA